MKVIDSFNDLFVDSYTPLAFATNFLRNFDKDISVRLDKEFEYDVLNNQIAIGLEKFLAPNSLENTTHRELLKEMGYRFERICTHQTFSFIHEFAHSQMLKLYGNEKWKELHQYVFDNELIRGLYDNKKITYRELQSSYMELDLEKDANDWAMLFIKENKKIVRTFDYYFMKHIQTMLSNRA